MKRYSIREASQYSGLPSSTLRYYETVGILDPVGRDASSGHRVYTQDDLTTLEAVSCLNASGLTLEEMRTYLQNRTRGVEGAKDQVRLLTAQRDRLEAERAQLELRLAYVNWKVQFWEAWARDDQDEVERTGAEAEEVAQSLKHTRR
ncbi:MAG: MerR family transcriptional regulator [Thermomicrobiales bacterium]